MGKQDTLNSSLKSGIQASFQEWLQIGTEGRSRRQVHRIILTNVMVATTALLSYLHAISFALYDLEQLKYPIFLMVVIATAILATPYLNKRNPYFGSVYNLLVWLGYGYSLVTIFGSESGVHFYFLAGAASAILLMGVYHNPLSVISTSLQIGLFMYFDEAIMPPSDVLQLDPIFYKSLYFAAIMLSMMFIFCMVFYAFYQAQLAEDALASELKFSERLLASMLPASIATQLKQNPDQTIAHKHDEVTILFADIVDFTPRAQKQTANELVTFLNDLFTRFDKLAMKYDLEKIKTLGDAFMVAGGMPDAQPDHAKRVAHMALEMLSEAARYSAETGDEIELRIGIHTGPAVAGVIGSQKPFYDVWGDTVNTAARMETHGTSGKIQMTTGTKQLLEKSFEFTKRGNIDIKGIGKLDLWYLTKSRF